MEVIYSDTTLTSPHMQRKETQNQTKETNKTQNEKKKKKGTPHFCGFTKHTSSTCQALYKGTVVNTDTLQKMKPQVLDDVFFNVCFVSQILLELGHDGKNTCSEEVAP